MKRVLCAVAIVMVVCLTACDSSVRAVSTTNYRAQHVRGFNVLFATVTEQDLLDAGVGYYGANTVRIMIMRDDLPLNYDRLDWIIGNAIENGMAVIVDMHEFYGLCRWTCESRGEYRDFSFWHPSQGAQNRSLLQETWVTIAMRYRSYPADVLMYELFNEPEPKFIGVDASGNLVAVSDDDIPAQHQLWYDLQDSIIESVRAVDPYKTLIVSPAESWRIDSLEAWSPSTIVKADGNLWATAHFYHPHDFTHQFEGTKKAYPGAFTGHIWNESWWDRAKLAEVMGAIPRFHRAFGIPVVVTEFSCVRDAPGCGQWLQDATDLFRELGVGWTYHAFRELDPHRWWDLELSPYDRYEVIMWGLRK